jgi:high-affinity nickel permease
MGTLILFFITIQVVLVINLYRSYQKIKKLDMEEREFQEYVENFGYDLDEYDDD